MKKTPKKVAQNRPRPLFPTVQPRPQPTAQNWFSISRNFGTRHLFSYLCVLLISRIHLKYFYQFSYSKPALVEKNWLMYVHKNISFFATFVTNQWPFFWILNEDWKAISFPELWQRVINVLLGKSKSGSIYSE